MIDVTDESFAAEVLADPGVVLVEFWAPWCRPCKQLAPILSELDTELTGVARVVRIDTDANTRVADTYGISSLPTLLVFAAGEVITALVGSRPKNALRDAIRDAARVVVESQSTAELTSQRGHA